MASGQFYRGENLRIKINGDPLFHATTCSLEMTTANEDLASKDITGTKRSMGLLSGTLSTDALLADKVIDPALPDPPTPYVDPIELLRFQQNKTLLDWEFTTGVSGDFIISGKCYVSNSTINAENQQIGTTSFTFLVDGDIVITKIS